ncbi:MAG: hypothetical protein ACI8QZ_000274 [Chlamydiales bacterium]
MDSSDALEVPRGRAGALLDRLMGGALVEDVRYEIKLIGEAGLYGALRADLALHPAGFRRLFPARVVQSLYFDTHDEDAVQQNLAGMSTRAKLRWRWYGIPADEVRGQMELKVRRNQLGWKLRAPLANPIRLDGERQSEFCAALAKRLPASWSDHLRSGLQLSQWIRYEREYYGSADRRVRVTVDRGLQLYDLRGWQRLDRRHVIPRSPVMIVEAKAAPQDHALLAACVSALPLPVDKCSKFVMAAAPGDAPTLSVMPR